MHRVEADLWITLAVAQLADGRQQRHLEEDHVQPGAFQAQAELALVDADLHVVGVEAEQPEEADEVGLEERDALQELQLLGAERQPGERLDLLADLRQVGAQVFPVAAAEFPFDFGVGVVVQDRLHHAQLVEVGIQQVLHDTRGECAVGHARGFPGLGRGSV
ncbi:hypothetical protein D3C76_1336180 [compost metagenome]